MEKLTEEQLKDYLNWIEKYKKQLQHDLDHKKQLLFYSNKIKSKSAKTEDQSALGKVRDLIGNIFSK